MNLPIPAPRALLPDRFAETIREAVATIDDLDALEEGRRRIAALRSYLAKKGQPRPEAMAAERWIELRIGELLGPAEMGRPTTQDESLPYRKLFSRPADLHEFRRLAAHRERVEELIGRGVVARPKILVALKTTDNAGVPLDGIEHGDLSALVATGKRFGTVYADPPWRYGNQATRAATGGHYGTLTVEEIAAMPVADLAADAAHLHLWTTNAFLFEAKTVIEAWGFEYKSILLWIKPTIGIGNYWRVSHEFLLLGVRGSCPFPKKGEHRSQLSWVQAPRLEHSEKPHCFREMIENVSPEPRIELFARNDFPGWLCWGNEVRPNLFSGRKSA